MKSTPFISRPVLVAILMKRIWQKLYISCWSHALRDYQNPLQIPWNTFSGTPEPPCTKSDYAKRSLIDTLLISAGPHLSIVPSQSPDVWVKLPWILQTRISVPEHPTMNSTNVRCKRNHSSHHCLEFWTNKIMRHYKNGCVLGHWVLE